MLNCPIQNADPKCEKYHCPMGGREMTRLCSGHAQISFSYHGRFPRHCKFDASCEFYRKS